MKLKSDEKVLACELPVLAAGETRQRIPVFPAAGDYVHPKSGPFTLTEDSLNEFAADINARGDNIVIDRDHAFLKGLPAPAAGWFVKGTAEASKDGVSAEVEWTPAAAEQVRNREYRFISPEFAFGHKTPQGQSIPEPKVHATTITNRPFFTMMLPIAAEDLDDDDVQAVSEEFGSVVADSLGEFDEETARGIIAAAQARTSFADPGYRKDGKQRYALTSAADVETAWKQIAHRGVAKAYSAEQISRMKARIKRAAKKFGITIGADSTAGGDMDLTALAEKFGLAADASEEDVLEAAAKVAAENADLKTKLAAAPGDDQMKLLLASAAKGETAAKELGEMKRDTAIKQAVTDLKIAASESTTYEGFWAIDPAGTEKLLAEMTPRLPAVPKGSEATTVPVMDANGKPVAAQAGNGGDLVADTRPVMVDGIPTPVDEDRAKIHAAAMDRLAKQNVNPGDDGFEEKYVAACIDVSGVLAVEL